MVDETATTSAVAGAIVGDGATVNVPANASSDADAAADQVESATVTDTGAAPTPPANDQPKLSGPEPAPQGDDAEPAPEIVSDARPLSLDPFDSPAACIYALGRFNVESEKLSAACAKFMREVQGEPELYHFLNSMDVALGQFRHAFKQVEDQASEEFLDAVTEALSSS